ncbi:Homeodomain-like protein with RING/FYVE/PHD-type zinc finger domain-containing protein [Heracleum sosnowskyi]|uniref:Homeodomain-like protein with RING/FYVE/PHD-type zinc finger domain-containing protein n=1 Tax=Heracleum sosnowskyi TaxID=360622 RepID=A0AAD8J0K6_9APIA|nr:Homeodomain-like protein with RING/FYVE/PHD-type zinc finger domain-containing protein [Heracleum sosnowskyi]
MHGVFLYYTLENVMFALKSFMRISGNLDLPIERPCLVKREKPHMFYARCTNDDDVASQAQAQAQCICVVEKILKNEVNARRQSERHGYLGINEALGLLFDLSNLCVDVVELEVLVGFDVVDVAATSVLSPVGLGIMGKYKNKRWIWGKSTESRSSLTLEFHPHHFFSSNFNPRENNMMKVALKMEEVSDPKPNALEQVLDTVPNGKCTAPVQLENLVAVDVQNTSDEAKVKGTVSAAAKIVRAAQDSTELLSCKDFVEDMKLCHSGPMLRQAESSIGISLIPKQFTLSRTHESGSEMVNNEIIQENHVITTEITYQKSEFDRINMEQKETIPEEVIRNSFLESKTYPIDNQSRNQNSDQSGLPPENAKDCKQTQMGHRSDDATKNSGLEELVIGQKTVARSPSQLVDTGKRSRGRPRKVQTGLEQLIPGQKTAAKSSSQLGDTGKRSRGRPRKVQNSPTSFLENINMEKKEAIPEQVTQNIFLESSTFPIDNLSRTYNSDQSGLPPGNAVKDCKHIQFGHQSDDATKTFGLEELVIGQETVAKSPSQLVDAGKRGRGRPRKVQSGLEHAVPGQQTAAKSSNQLGDAGKRSRGRPRKVQNSPTSLGGSVKVLPEKRKDSQELSVNSSRSLRSRSQEKSIEPDFSNIVAEEGADREKTRKKRKKRMEENRVDEFSRIRTHLRYLLHRIKYEKNFLDAYSGEGWKGQSLDKIKPEKELKRAKAEIFGRKLKIRDLFQRLDLSRSEGRLPEILFDSRGEIDSEEIFCAKCGSKDVTLSNDIILCDGACDRGFHQFCLDPPLLKEYIPPDDEGWLCPGCECKIDCIKLLNDSQETNILLGDSWEKIFAEEAAAAASGKNLDDNSGMPSDDSEDDDYDPGGPDLDEKVQGDDSSTDESDYQSASDDMQVLPQKESCGLPPDDSEDDNYDPSALVIDQMFKDSSCSDFTSDSEDFTGMLDDCKHTGKAQGPQASTPDHVGNTEEGCGHPEQGDTAPLYPRRQVESLDYKKLHDEEYGNTSSDSSDEDFMVTSSPDKNSSDKEATVLLDFGSLNMEHGKESSDLELDQKASKSTHNRRSVQKFAVEGTDSLLSRPSEDSATPVTSSKSTSRTFYREHATQRLLQSFKENQYPQRAVKESLAAELSLSVRQVSTWFNNTRWSFRHSSRFASDVAEYASNEGTSRQISVNMSGSRHTPCITETSEEKTKVGSEATEPTIRSLNNQEQESTKPNSLGAVRMRSYVCSHYGNLCILQKFVSFNPSKDTQEEVINYWTEFRRIVEVSSAAIFVATRRAVFRHSSCAIGRFVNSPIQVCIQNLIHTLFPQYNFVLRT